MLTGVFSPSHECGRASFTSSKAASNRRETAHQTAQQILAADLDRRGARMLEEDGPVGLTDWETCDETLKATYRYLAMVELLSECRRTS